MSCPTVGWERRRTNSSKGKSKLSVFMGTFLFLTSSDEENWEADILILRFYPLENTYIENEWRNSGKKTLSILKWFSVNHIISGVFFRLLKLSINCDSKNPCFLAFFLETLTNYHWKIRTAITCTNFWKFFFKISFSEAELIQYENYGFSSDELSIDYEKHSLYFMQQQDK